MSLIIVIVFNNYNQESNIQFMKDFYKEDLYVSATSMRMNPTMPGTPQPLPPSYDTVYPGQGQGQHQLSVQGQPPVQSQNQAQTHIQAQNQLPGQGQYPVQNLVQSHSPGQVHLPNHGNIATTGHVLTPGPVLRRQSVGQVTSHGDRSYQDQLPGQVHMFSQYSGQNTVQSQNQRFNLGHGGGLNEGSSLPS